MKSLNDVFKNKLNDFHSIIKYEEKLINSPHEHYISTFENKIVIRTLT